MPITSYIVDEHKGQGKGHTSHGNGKGLGHVKHAQEAAADGEYTIRVAGIDHQDHTTPGTTRPQETLADGSKINTEVRQGSITIDVAPGGEEALHLVTDSANGRLRLNVENDADQRVTLGDLDELSFDYYIESSDRSDVIPVIRLFIDADGNLATTGDRGELVFEYAYQGLGPTTQDAWQHVDLVGSDWTAWQRLVAGVYYWRARTEERHLMADPHYQDYAAWMQRNAPLPRLLRRMRRLPEPRALPAE